MARMILLAALAALITSPAWAVPCSESAGRSSARRYVEHCQMVSNTPHAACRAYYSCPIIEDEIRRGCKALKKDAPTFCQAYQRP